MRQLYLEEVLLYMLKILSLSVACVYRHFSKRKLIKIFLESQQSKVRLDKVHRIGTRLSKDGYGDCVYEYFVDELQKRDLNMSIEI